MEYVIIIFCSLLWFQPDNGSIVAKVLNKAGDTEEEPKKDKSRDDRKRDVSFNLWNHKNFILPFL